ncbi:MAG TPA: hypothetical protein VN872_09105 [Candidatus Acidoferrum sp.]|nr:hypothetical protein [Candidatus Acidoferrum sp.]
MKYLKCVLFVLTFAATLSAECSRWNAQTDTPPAQELASFLEQKDVLAAQTDCAIAAMEILGHEHATAYIPQLVNFLTFRRKFYWEGTGFNMRPVTELDHYPAAMALFEIGKSALPALLAVASEEKPDSLKFTNAVSTVMLIHRDQSAGGVHFLRQAALKQEDYMRRANLNAAVVLAETLCAKDIHETHDSCLAAGGAPQDPPKNQTSKKQ